MEENNTNKILDENNITLREMTSNVFDLYTPVLEEVNDPVEESDQTSTEDNQLSQIDEDTSDE